jgi:hypothetical protein
MISLHKEFISREDYYKLVSLLIPFRKGIQMHFSASSRNKTINRPTLEK